MVSRLEQVQLQNRIVSHAEAVAQKRFANVFNAAAIEAIKAYEATGSLTIPDSHRPAVEIALADAWGRAGRLLGQTVLQQFKSGFVHLETKVDEESLFQRILREFIEQFGALRVEQITNGTMQSMQRVIAQGAIDGVGIAEIAKRLNLIMPAINRHRAAVIARTETHSASQYASLETAKTSRFQLNKEWASNHDHRTRDFGEGDGIIDEFSHRAVDGQTVPTDQFFIVPRRNGTFENIMQPGDINASAGNVINCRCAMLFVRAG